MSNQQHHNLDPEMRDEYDFSGKTGVCGKYAARFRKGYSIVIHHADGTTTTERHMPAAMITLDPDVQAYFPDAVSVNQALRAIISILPAVRTPASTAETIISGDAHTP